ncbi:MAG: hypothetical protein L0271_19400, partial [Gemmatimonadetes bacterium]|nr:hypothetical protein [Gemmatimonadota bacterium]
DPQAMIKENEMDGVWGACLQPSQGLFWYRIPDSALLSAICRVYNDWIADFCKPYPDRLKGIAMLNVTRSTIGSDGPRRTSAFRCCCTSARRAVESRAASSP